MNGYTIKEAAKQAKIGYAYARKICSGSGKYGTTEVNINALVKQERAVISQKVAKKLEITKERQLKEYEEIKNLAKDSKEYTAAKGCLDSQTRIIGGFDADYSGGQEKAPTVIIIGNSAKKAINSRETPLLGDNTGGLE